MNWKAPARRSRFPVIAAGNCHATASITSSSILQQAVNQAGLKCPSLIGKRISPHVVRHSTAMHLLQSGVDISLIALWLGHESIETTHVYIDADLATKQRALEKLAPAEAASFRFKPSDSMLAFLQQL
ncbi:tyrosine-type recombinase/integrase [Burkholderia ubonensis]|uniref:tyrosine-type recombinase/integrase n=1 Tax=Burkholderia ubonensis TaxID=101571 RepID=UPI0020C9008B|nr:tyrosine-type recombinase/integrase [Burkholderia ubonensis]